MTRIWRNVDKILAIERDGRIVFGTPKVLRAVDITVEDRPDEHWVGVGESEAVTQPIRPAALGALRVEPVRGGLAVVFPVGTKLTESDLPALLAALPPPPDPREEARARLRAAKATLAGEMQDVLTVLGI